MNPDKPRLTIGRDLTLRHVMQDAERYRRNAERHAQDVLVMAARANIPDKRWSEDGRIMRACRTLGWTPEEGLAWVRSELA